MRVKGTGYWGDARGNEARTSSRLAALGLLALTNQPLPGVPWRDDEPTTTSGPTDPGDRIVRANGSGPATGTTPWSGSPERCEQ